VFIAVAALETTDDALTRQPGAFVLGDPSSIMNAGRDTVGKVAKS